MYLVAKRPSKMLVQLQSSALTTLMGAGLNAPISKKSRSAPPTSLQPFSIDAQSALSSGRRIEVIVFALFKHLSAL